MESWCSHGQIHVALSREGHLETYTSKYVMQDHNTGQAKQEVAT